MEPQLVPIAGYLLRMRQSAHSHYKNHPEEQKKLKEEEEMRLKEEEKQKKSLEELNIKEMEATRKTIAADEGKLRVLRREEAE
ncbi:hypothetical protein PR048_008643 [Dryococelus australis]|uniref:Uncharacterized protein n=1 Tax=Dryococelus australis TaxID=614101 RepID=A0ABQ9HYI5_9NEOP|nr:hypothetical protein PR048_008643 [Dryococelus australis]